MILELAKGWFLFMSRRLSFDERAVPSGERSYQRNTEECETVLKRELLFFNRIQEVK